ncbi:flavin-containing monooxygenase [Tsuneonella sp. SYSU-LHT278]|uniref:flavin-containing monooxygenase n=1 Tax=Tsuneonella sediminis TaxID=3416089 RepID=UPI003F7A323F
MSQSGCDVDVLIVGAGISGIGMAARLGMECQQRTYAVVERRAKLGGTWDLFRYPGIRSDSDMHSLSYEFEPWTGTETLARAERIQHYLEEVAGKYGVAEHIRYNTKVLSAAFDTAAGCWTVELEDESGWQAITANFLYLAAGYYDYDDPHVPDFEGEDAFDGPVVHPQHWPEGLDYTGKRVAVIGSGATAVTIVPNMADAAAKVTMIQRTPTYVRSIPAEDPIGRLLRRFLPLRLALKITRWMHIRVGDKMYKTARREPEKVRARIERDARKHLGEHYRPEDFTPPYAPWDQRMCFVPDADLFERIKDGSVEIVNGTIERFASRGIVMTDGRTVPADIIVKATGLRLAMGGKVELRVDGNPVVPSEHWFYKNAMLSGVPNLVLPVPYTNAGSTLRFDLVSRYTCRVLNRMTELGAAIAVPTIPEGAEPDVVQAFDLNAGYVQRSGNMLPKSSSSDPWRLNHDYLHDRRYMAENPVDDGLLRFHKAGEEAKDEQRELEAAE